MNPDMFEGLRKTLDRFRSAVLGVNKFNEQLLRMADEVRSFYEATGNIASKSLESFSSLKNIFQELDKAGLTPNLGDGRSIRDLKLYRKLLGMGYAIFWVPREEVVNKLLNSKTEAARKATVVGSQSEVLDDCEMMLSKLQSAYTKNMRLHLKSAIDCMRADNHRAAQSTVAVCFDSLLDQIIDTSSLSRFNELAGKINGDAQALKVFDNIPIQYLYAALQSQLIAYSLRGFERLRPMTVRTKYSRHSSIHSVSARQYNKFNALQAIMITTSLLATTDKLGRGWVTGLAALV